MPQESPQDVFELLEPLIRSQVYVNPWERQEDGSVRYQADFGLLQRMLTVPVTEGTGSQSGRLAKAIDAWVAQELRRAGFGDDEVWPRLTSPRVVPREVAMFVDSLPRSLKPAVQAQLLRNTKVAPSDARVLGRAYVKQVDVLIAQWSRGPELLVSTKSMASSFRKNLANRFEESYGDAKNLRGRYPMAAMGFLFVLRSTAQEEPGTVERAVDMLRKLKAEHDVYDATCLLMAEWGTPGSQGVSILHDVIPDDLGANAFLKTLVEGVLSRTPVDMHVAVRERHEHRDIPLEDSDEPS